MGTANRGNACAHSSSVASNADQPTVLTPYTVKEMTKLHVIMHVLVQCKDTLLLPYTQVQLSTHPEYAEHTGNPSLTHTAKIPIKPRTCSRFCLRALASATFLMGRASMAARRAFSASMSSLVTCTGRRGMKYVVLAWCEVWSK